MTAIQGLSPAAHTDADGALHDSRTPGAAGPRGLFAGLLAHLQRPGAARAESRSRKAEAPTAAAEAEAARAMAALLQTSLVLPKAESRGTQASAGQRATGLTSREPVGAQPRGAGRTQTSAMARAVAEAAGAHRGHKVAAAGLAGAGSAEPRPSSPLAAMALEEAGKALGSAAPRRDAGQGRVAAPRGQAPGVAQTEAARAPLLAQHPALRSVTLASEAFGTGAAGRTKLVGGAAGRRQAEVTGPARRGAAAAKSPAGQGEGAGAEVQRASAASESTSSGSAAPTELANAPRPPSAPDRGGATEQRRANAPERQGTEAAALAGAASLGAASLQAAQLPGSSEATGVSAARQLAEFVAARLPEAPARFELTLSPEHLGTVDVRLTVQGDAVHLALVTQHGETRELLARELGDLRQALGEHGLNLAGADVSSQDDAQRQASAFQFERDERQGGARPRPAEEAAPRSAPATASEPMAAAKPVVPRARRGEGLDIHA